MRLILLCSVIFGLGSVLHDFHVSVVDIEHDKETNAIQVSHRIFIDDLEKGLMEFHELDKVDTYKPEDTDKLDSLIGPYLKNNVFITIDGKDYQFNYLGSELETDARWCYYEIESIESINTAEVTAVTLMEIFDDQQNIVHFKANGKLKSYKLDKDDKIVRFEF